MYPKKAFSTREQDYSALLRKKLEEAEVMLRQLNPSMERGLALTKLDECLLWANVSIAGTGISKYWRVPHERPAQGYLVPEVHSVDPGFYDYDFQLRMADAVQSSIQRETTFETDAEMTYMNTAKNAESVKAAGEHIAVRKADTTAHELEKLKSMVSAANALSSAIDKWNEEKKSWEVHQNEREHPDQCKETVGGGGRVHGL